MAYKKELEIMPSLIQEMDGTETELGKLAVQKRKEKQDRMCGKISQSLCEYFSAHPEEWNDFVKLISQKEM